MIKWWRTDKKCGKKDLFDISQGEVLVVPSPDSGATDIMLKAECRIQKAYKALTGAAVQDDDDDDEVEGWYTKTGRKRKQKKAAEGKRVYKRKKITVDPQEDSDKIGKDSASSPTESRRKRPKPTKLGRPRSLPIDGDNDSSVPPNAVLSVSGEDDTLTPPYILDSWSRAPLLLIRFGSVVYYSIVSSLLTSFLLSFLVPSLQIEIICLDMS